MNGQETQSLPVNMQVAKEIIQLYERYGDKDCEGEPVSQTSHMIQCAMRAIEDTVDAELIIGAFLHDIGLLIMNAEPVTTDPCGHLNHERTGADYLRKKGFPEKICTLVGMHVQAKRYLVATNADYAKKLSEGSWHMLQLQGGVMTHEEVQQFRQHPYFKDIIKIRYWDEEANDPYAVLFPLYHFRKLLEMYLINVQVNEAIC